MHISFPKSQSLKLSFPICRDVNTTIMELLIMVYACRTSCARNIIGVIPYFPYSKQCKMRKRGSIVSKLLASMMCKAGKSETKLSLHLWFIRKLGNYSLLTLSNVALSRSDSSHYYGFASKGNPGFLQHSSGQSPGLTVPATVHTGRSRSLLNACLDVMHEV